MDDSEKHSQKAKRQRKERASTNYGKNEDGKWVRKRHFRECDYTVEGHLLEFDSQEAFLNFEEDRHQQGGGTGRFGRSRGWLYQSHS